jgi:RNA-directed DNA polymerase
MASWAPYQRQHGRCPFCGDWLLPADGTPPTPHQWEQWLATTRKTIILVNRQSGTSDKTRLIHTHCHRRHTADEQQTASTLLPRPPATRACLSRVRGNPPARF